METLGLIDVHAHLEELPDLAKDIKEAKEAGVIAIIGVGSGLESNKKILEIAKTNPNYIFPALGYHPWEINEEEVKENLLFLRSHIHECIALGEVGLDYKTKVKKELQSKVFNEILDMAFEFNKPVIIHSRYSHEKTLRMVEEKGVRQAVFHWYTGPSELLAEILSRGYFISATPALAYSPPHQEAIKKTPLEKILLETDSPVSYQGRESRPKDVRITLELVSSLKGIDLQTVQRQTNINATQFFKLPFIT